MTNNLALAESSLPRDPVEIVVEDLGDAGGRDATGTAACKTGLYHGITVEDLRAKWQEAVVGLAGRDIAVTNADNALEGALAIRYRIQTTLHQIRPHVSQTMVGRMCEEVLSTVCRPQKFCGGGRVRMGREKYSHRPSVDWTLVSRPVVRPFEVKLFSLFLFAAPFLPRMSRH